MLDLGCGYGAIGITVAWSAPEARVTLVDVDARAVALARANCQRNGVTAAARVADGPAALGERFDLSSPISRCTPRVATASGWSGEAPAPSPAVACASWCSSSTTSGRRSRSSSRASKSSRKPAATWCWRPGAAGSLTGMAETAFVTGGSGFIGGRLIKRLRAEGWDVRALARSERSADTVCALGAEPVRGDISSVASVREGAAGCSHAFHAAAHVGDWGDRDDFVRDNVQGTVNTLAGTAAAGVGRFVHVGTEAALLAGQALVNVDESAPLRPDSPSLYPSTKAMAEQAVRQANRTGSFETVVVRPRFVWGPGDTTILPSVSAAVTSGQFRWVGGGHHRTSTTHVDNTVEGLWLGATRGRPGAAYFVTDGEPVVFRDFVTRLLHTQGLTAPDAELPLPVARFLTAAGEAAWRALPLPGAPPLTRMTLWVSSLECTIDISLARSELGYVPVRSIDDGLDELSRPAA